MADKQRRKNNLASTISPLAIPANQPLPTGEPRPDVCCEAFYGIENNYGRWLDNSLHVPRDEGRLMPEAIKQIKAADEPTQNHLLTAAAAMGNPQLFDNVLGAVKVNQSMPAILNCVESWDSHRA